MRDGFFLFGLPFLSLIFRKELKLNSGFTYLCLSSELNFMNTDTVRILDQEAVEAKLLRMAYEIFESHYGKDAIVLIGIDERGGFLGARLLSHLQNISNLTITFLQATLDRQDNDSLIGVDLGIEDLQDLAGKHIVVVDDVLYSGTTLLNVISILLQARPASIQTAVLIDRGHRLVPVAADFTGMQLATTIQQHVQVTLDKGTERAEAFLL